KVLDHHLPLESSELVQVPQGAWTSKQCQKARFHVMHCKDSGRKSSKMISTSSLTCSSELENTPLYWTKLPQVFEANRDVVLVSSKFGKPPRRVTNFGSGIFSWCLTPSPCSSFNGKFAV